MCDACPTEAERQAAAVADGFPSEYAPVPVLCEYYLMCLNLTLHATRHPILGDVPTCERCETLHIMRGGHPAYLIGSECELCTEPPC